MDATESGKKNGKDTSKSRATAPNSSEIAKTNASKRSTRDMRVRTHKRLMKAQNISEIFPPAKKQQLSSVPIIDLESIDSEDYDGSDNVARYEKSPVSKRELRSKGEPDTPDKNDGNNKICDVEGGDINPQTNIGGISKASNEKANESKKAVEISTKSNNQAILERKNLRSSAIKESGTRQTSTQEYAFSEVNTNSESDSKEPLSSRTNGEISEPTDSGSPHHEKVDSSRQNLKEKSSPNSFSENEDLIVLDSEEEEESGPRKSWRIQALARKNNKSQDSNFRVSSEPAESQSMSISSSANQASNSEKSGLSLVPVSKNTQLKIRTSDFTCMICFKECKDFPNLDAHFKTHTRQKSFECLVCFKKLSTQRTLNDHMKVHAGEKQNCEACGRELSSLKALNEHMKIHTGERPFECTICHKSFRFRGNLADHMRIHNDDKFQCIVCQKRLATKRNLNDHMRMHDGEKFQCAICESELSSIGALNVHMSSHDGQKHYECAVCDRVLSSKQNLNDHMATHAEKKPFECNICHKDLSSQKALSVHEKSHSDEKPFECEICKAGLRSKQSLISHVAGHSKPKKYQCSICEEGINSKKKLTLHMKIHA